MRISKTNSAILFLILFALMLTLLDSQLLLGGNNLPILFLLFSLLLYPKYNKRCGELELWMDIYWAYLSVVTVIHIRSNFNISNSIFSVIQYLIILICCKVAINKMDLTKFFSLIRNAGIILSILAIIEAITKKPFLAMLLQKGYMIDFTGYRVNSIFGHPIVCGVYLLVSWCILLEFPLRKFRLNIIAHLLVLSAVVLNRSRSVWLALVIVIILEIAKKTNWSKLKIQKKWLERVFILIFAFVTIDAILQFRITTNVFHFIQMRIVGSLYAGEGQGNIIRIDTILNSLKYWIPNNIDKMIFGMGKNWDKYFMTLFPVVKWGNAWTAAVDNQYFATIHEAGLLGLSCLIVILIKTLGRIKNISKLDRVAMVSNISLVGVFVTMLFFEGINMPSILTLIVILILASDRCYLSGKTENVLRPSQRIAKKRYIKHGLQEKVY